MSEALLREALEAAAAALAAGDGPGARAAAERAAAACAALAREGAPLDPSALAELREALGRASASAAHALRRLGSELQHTALFQRAAGAYRTGSRRP